jgi:hypothetical protein
MRWGRGFFRLWLFLSVIWIAVSVYGYGPRYQFRRVPILEFESPSGQRFLVDSSKSREEINAQIVAVLERETAAALPPLPPGYVLDHPYDDKTRDALLKTTESKTEEARTASLRAWLTTLVPPFALLGFGLTV